MKAKIYFLLSLPKQFVLLFRLRNIVKLGRTTFALFAFVILLFGYIIGSLLSKIRSFLPASLGRIISPPFAKLYKLLLRLNNSNEKTISRINLIELAIKNMFAKKSRTIITIGGMSIGIGAIVFLVSLGYGVQQLVISRVARLDELKQANVVPQPGSKNRINDKTISDLKAITDVKDVLPLIAVVGKIKFQSSVSDVAAYGVTTEYLKQSAIKPIKGEIYASDELASSVPGNPLMGGDSQGDVAGISDVLGVSTENVGEIRKGEKIGEVEYSINQNEWIRVRDSAGTSGTVLGYTKRSEGQQVGEEYWGSSYPEGGKEYKDITGKSVGKWIKSKVHLWKKEECKVGSDDCIGGSYVMLRDDQGIQKMVDGFFAEINVSVKGSYTEDDTAVLGISTESDVLAESSASADIIESEDGFVEIATLSAQIKQEEITRISLGTQAKKLAVVNTQLLDLLGLTPDNAIGKTFSVSFVVTGDLLTQSESKVESNEDDYTIVGVIPSDKSPVMYVPFIDLRSLGIVNFSQAKVVSDNTEALTTIRKQISAMGFSSSSVSDTVVQINSLFATVRLLLAALGLVALSVASLGMFNTLTVSLMERTREVGLMKAMGMRSREIHELFLTESMIMGIFGGLLGLAWGFGIGKFLGAILSIFTVTKGIGFIDVTYIPIAFVLLIISLSLIVGILTGIYPARRATKISALDALRYE